MKQRQLALLAAGWLVVGLLGGFALPGQAERLWRQGDRAYARKKYDVARQCYEQAQQLRPQDWNLRYNAAVAAAMAKDYEKAVAGLQAVAKDGPANLREPAEYNLGNCYLAQQKAAEAVEHYKRALYLKPDDMNAKWNLELAKRQQQQQQKQQNQQQQQQQKQQQQQQQNQPQQQKQQRQQQQQSGQQPQMKQDEARRLLQSLSQQDRDLQKQMRQPKQQLPEGRPDKDW